MNTEQLVEEIKKLTMGYKFVHTDEKLAKQNYAKGWNAGLRSVISLIKGKQKTKPSSRGDQTDYPVNTF